MKLRPSRAWFLAAALACCWGASGASADPAGSLPVSQSPYPRAPVLPSLSPGLGEIIQLVLSRTEENVLVSFVAKSKREYAPTVAELIYLRDVGVSGPVIAALILRAKRQPPGVVSGAPPPPKHKAQRYGREGFLELAQVRMSDQVLLAYLHTMDSPPQWGSQYIQIFKSQGVSPEVLATLHSQHRGPSVEKETRPAPSRKPSLKSPNNRIRNRQIPVGKPLRAPLISSEQAPEALPWPDTLPVVGNDPANTSIIKPGKKKP